MSRNQAVDLSAGARFLDPRVLAKIGNLELVARTVVEGFINGLHRSPHLGLSMDFAEHRAYMPGDDIRRIDWRVYGRTERFYVKEFEADTNANFGVLLDISRSMSFASPGAGLSKLDYARYLAACLAYFSHRQRDRVGLVTFDEDIVDFVPPSAKHLPIVLHTLDRIESKNQGALGKPMLKIAENFRRRSILLVISDLYEEPRSVLQALDYLRNKGSDLIVMHVLDPAELEFPFDEAASFQDLETGVTLPVIPDYLRDQYRALVTEHVRGLSRLLGENGIDYAMFDTSKPLDHALFNYLSNRQRLMRVR
ncbi:MAG TPA: DUF58 domain-containing protein [Gemmatimonadaceae bacterium]|nr:DUF58 domain-containing protein [Gemmatimonadaceae bacterium]